MAQQQKSKKSAKTATKKLDLEITPDSLTPAEYNPRTMDDETREGLKVSMSEFDDISGITWNKQTGNIVTGHHRWGNLLDLHGKENLVFHKISADRYAVHTVDGLDTTFTLRVVDWDALKEKAANVAANSQALSGEFNSGLDGILSELRTELDSGLFSELRFDNLSLPQDVNSIDSGEWQSNIASVEKIESNLSGIISTIKIEIPQDLRSEFFACLKEMIDENGYSDKVKVK